MGAFLLLSIECSTSHCLYIAMAVFAKYCFPTQRQKEVQTAGHAPRFRNWTQPKMPSVRWRISNFHVVVTQIYIHIVFQQIDIKDSTDSGGGPTLKMFGVTEVRIHSGASIAACRLPYHFSFLFMLKCSGIANDSLFRLETLS